MKKLFIIIILIFSFILGYFFGYQNRNNQVTIFQRKNAELIMQLSSLKQQVSELNKQTETPNCSKDCISQTDISDKHPIDIEEEKCIYSTHPYNYSDCAKQSSEQWKAEINKQLEYMKKTMTPNEFEVVDKSQLNWQKSFESDEKMINKFISQRQGAINETSGFSYISNINKQRALLLEQIYKNYSEEIDTKQY